MTRRSGATTEAASFEDRGWHAWDVDEALAALRSDWSGLTTEEARRRLGTDGPNVLPEEPPVPAWRRFARQFANLLIYVLLAAAALTATFGDWIETGVILAVVLLNAVIGYVQEGRAEAALASLRDMLALDATVLRDGRRREIPAAELVRGDVVVLEPGDKVPADVRVVAAHDLRVEEAALTGESVPIDKHREAVADDAALGDRRSMAFSGTTVAAGAGRGLVVATGQDTEVGRIGQMVARVTTLRTPFLEMIDRFSRTLAYVITGASAALFAFGVLVRGYPANEAFLMVIGLAVAAIPEGLPAIITITLALGVQRMARRQAIVRRLPAVETLGSVTTICTDKTGTLTRNEMTVRAVRTADATFSVEGEGYDPHGAVTREGEPDVDVDDPDLRFLARIGALCSVAEFRTDEHGGRALSGDPTEGAVLTLAHKLGVDQEHLDAVPRLDLLPFESARGYAASLIADEDGPRIAVKGAPERVLDRCSHVRTAFGDAVLERERWEHVLDDLASQAYRVLAVATKAVPAGTDRLRHADVASGLTLLGVLALMDPPRQGVKEALAACHRAGIRVLMITGDHARTAGAIASQLGLRGPDDGAVLAGPELEEMDDEALDEAVLRHTVFARSSPEHKLRILQALQRHGEVAAMTGDGVNDAPALKRADVGIAMGLKGSEAAKDASEMVLGDDDFTTITQAVAEGRTTYDNLKKAILFILPTNGAEALVVTAGILAAVTALPITTVQILWVNMVTAVTLALALAFEPAESDVMARPPRARNAPILSRYLVGRIAYVSVLLGGATLLAYFLALQRGFDVNYARTLAVNVLVAGEVVYMVNVRVLTGSALLGGRLLANPAALASVAVLVVVQAVFTYAPPFQRWFGTAPLGAGAWAWVAVAGLALFAVVEIEKVVTQRLQARRATR
ncbi:MAG: HAD-IC family P-type ATPase [Trueperaceae bacterium]|nr:HAD-IC family P-type ATPase [Trueperaceae bacterium]